MFITTNITKIRHPNIYAHYMAMHTSAHTTCMSQTVEVCGNVMFILIIASISLLPERLTPVHVTLTELGQPQGVSLLITMGYK